MHPTAYCACTCLAKDLTGNYRNNQQLSLELKAAFTHPTLWLKQDYIREFIAQSHKYPPLGDVNSN